MITTTTMSLKASTGEGMKILQKHGIVHRDLKPSNILIKFSSPEKKSFAVSTRCTVSLLAACYSIFCFFFCFVSTFYLALLPQIKLADFGFARHFMTEGSKLVDMTSLAGTPVFMVSVMLSLSCGSCEFL